MKKMTLAAVCLFIVLVVVSCNVPLFPQDPTVNTHLPPFYSFKFLQPEFDSDNDKTYTDPLHPGLVTVDTVSQQVFVSSNPPHPSFFESHSSIYVVLNQSCFEFTHKPRQDPSESIFTSTFLHPEAMFNGTRSLGSSFCSLYSLDDGQVLLSWCLDESGFAVEFCYCPHRIQHCICNLMGEFLTPINSSIKSNDVNFDRLCPSVRRIPRTFGFSIVNTEIQILVDFDSLSLLYLDNSTSTRTLFVNGNLYTWNFERSQCDSSQNWEEFYPYIQYAIMTDFNFYSSAIVSNDCLSVDSNGDVRWLCDGYVTKFRNNEAEFELEFSNHFLINDDVFNIDSFCQSDGN
ncbi:hypothetical protein P9112_000856 [Eukaryota sp. TZLM1-RC]